MTGLPIFGTSNFTSGHWEPEPTTRGTWGIVQSCVFTLGLCVYTAVHVNVFNAELSQSRRWFIKVKWMFIALLCPELVVFNAWFQRRTALNIAKILRQRSGQDEKPPQKYSPEIRLEKWTMKFAGILPRTLYPIFRLSSDERKGLIIASVLFILFLPIWVLALPFAWYSGVFRKRPKSVEKPEIFGIKHEFLIAMGGLVIDRGPDYQVHKKNHKWRVGNRARLRTITPRGFYEFFGSEEFRPVDLRFLTTSAIEARQKVNVFTKLLTIVQACWFSAQFFGRLCQGLPVSLLELNTLAHVICALAMYILWWNKPADLEDPFVLEEAKYKFLSGMCYGRESQYGLWSGELDENSKMVRSRMRNFAIQDIVGIWSDRIFTIEDQGRPVLKLLWPLMIALLVPSCVYSGIHLLAWDSAIFQKSSVSETIWKVACLQLLPLTLFLTAVVMGIIGLLLNDFNRESLPETSPRDDMLRKATVATVAVFGSIIAAASFLAYLVARAYLQVEVFLTVAYVDRGVYTVPRFAAYWPHI